MARRKPGWVKTNVDWDTKKVIWQLWVQGDTIGKTVTFFELHSGEYKNAPTNRDTVSKVRDELDNLPESLVCKLVAESPLLKDFIIERRSDLREKLEQTIESGAKGQQLPIQEQIQTDSFVEEAQKEHLSEIRSLIENWRDYLFTPHIKESVPGYHHPINEVQTAHLFEQLKEHLPSPTLWLNYSIWSDRIDTYLSICAGLMEGVRMDYRFNDKYLTDSGESVWVNTENYAYHVPIIKRISSKAVDNQDNKHKIEFQVFDESDEHKNLESWLDIKTWVMYVDDTSVGQCIDKKLATETYEAASDYHLNEAEHIIILFRELKTLEDKIRQDIVEALAYQDYRWYNCQFCKNYHFPYLKKQRWPQWTEQSMYTALAEEHFRSLIPASKELTARLKILISFREQWINRGVPTIEGNIIDGCFLINPTTKKDWIRVHYSEFQNPLDNSQRLDIHKPMDSLQAHCLLEHFHKQFPKLNPYDSWRDLNFDNLHPTLLRTICSWLKNEEFRQQGCYVCWLLKEKFGKNILLEG